MFFDEPKPSYGFEIGVVYRSKEQRHFLAVDKSLLVTFVYDVVVECTPGVKPSVCRNINVERLCEKWGITMNQLDEMSEEYFSPVKSDKVKRRIPDKFSSKRNYSQDALNSIWASHRTHRVVRE